MHSRPPAAPPAGGELAADVAARARRAAALLRGEVWRTLLAPAPELATPGGTAPLLKLESHQYTGSFKYRGALHKLLCLSREQRERGVVAASSGNHALAVCRGLARLGMTGTLFLPETASSAKLARLRKSGVELRLVGEDCVEAERAARSFAAEHGRAYVSPYNDLDVVAGQGSIGVELLEQCPELDAVFATVGGGGLIGGLGAVLRCERPGIEVVGCLPERSPVMAESVRRGEAVTLPSLPTLSDGSAGGIEEGALTLELCRQVVDRFVLVSESEIARAMVTLMRERREIIEGSAGVTLAAWLREAHRFEGKRVALVMCGRNVALATLKQLLRGAHDAQRAGEPGTAHC